MTETGAAGPVPPRVARMCREYAALVAAGTGDRPLAEFLDAVVALAVRTLPTARSARIHVRAPEVVTAGAAADATADGVLAIPLVGRGDLAGVLEIAPADGRFPADERELAEVLAVLLTLSLGTGRAA